MDPGFGRIGRSSKIRTYDPHVPNVVLYQAELYSDACARAAFYTVLRMAQRGLAGPVKGEPGRAEAHPDEQNPAHGLRRRMHEAAGGAEH